MQNIDVWFSLIDQRNVFKYGLWIQLFDRTKTKQIVRKLRLTDFSFTESFLALTNYLNHHIWIICEKQHFCSLFMEVIYQGWMRFTKYPTFIDLVTYSIFIADYIALFIKSYRFTNMNRESSENSVLHYQKFWKRNSVYSCRDIAAASC